MSEVSTPTNKRDLILAAIREGGATKESLMEIAAVNKAGLASQLSYLNTRGLNIAEVDPSKAEFPILKDGVFFMGSLEDYNAKTKAVGVASRKPKTVEQVREDAQKREDKASAAYTKASEKSAQNPSDVILSKVAEIRKLELELAGLKLGKIDAGIYDYENVTIVDSVLESTEVTEDENPNDYGDMLGA